MSVFFAVAAGYILGSLSPAYFLGRLLKNIDIRHYGDSNAGTVNTYRVLGFWPAAITAAVDVSKGLGAYFLASGVFGLHPPVSLLAPAAAIAGHVAPFYLKFRGGQGVATAVVCFSTVWVLAYSPGSFLSLTFCFLPWLSASLPLSPVPVKWWA
jgi:glycerol-3-phosphate acyltransferase PlsY